MSEESTFESDTPTREMRAAQAHRPKPATPTLAGQVVFITGGARGLGAAIGSVVGAEGAHAARAALLVCNDTGVSHIVASLGTRSVVISNGADVSRWAPLATGYHPVLWHPIECRTCVHAICPRDDACAQAISTARVTEAVEAALTA